MTTSLQHNSFEHALISGLHWLYHTEQPVGALVERCGVRITVPSRALRFLPISDGCTPAIVVDATVPGPTCTCVSTTPATLPEAELVALADQLATRGLPAAGWHHHCTTGTVSLSIPVHPSLRAAVDRYTRGCPWHHTPVCDAPISAGGLACPWHNDGHQMARWPSTPRAATQHCRPERKTA